jgi:hypothetical protein
MLDGTQWWPGQGNCHEPEEGFVRWCDSGSCVLGVVYSPCQAKSCRWNRHPGSTAPLLLPPLLSVRCLCVSGADLCGPSLHPACSRLRPTCAGVSATSPSGSAVLLSAFACARDPNATADPAAADLLVCHRFQTLLRSRLARLYSSRLDDDWRLTRSRVTAIQFRRRLRSVRRQQFDGAAMAINDLAQILRYPPPTVRPFLLYVPQKAARHAENYWLGRIALAIPPGEYHGSRQHEFPEDTSRGPRAATAR